MRRSNIQIENKWNLIPSTMMVLLLGLFALPLTTAGVESLPSDINESDALLEIQSMPIETCRGAVELNRKFYESTKGMSEAERQLFFKKFQEEAIANGYPAPRPPPAPGSAIDFALAKRCGKK